MKMSYLLRGSVVVVLCLVLAIPGFPQSGYGPNISNGEIAGVLVAAGAVIGVVIYVAYRQTHKHPSVTGCVGSGGGGLTLTNAKDKKVYALSGNLSAVKEGQQVKVKGKKSKDATGTLLFQVEQVTKDLGVCHS